MSQEKMQRARELLKAKRYDEARAILITVDHPVARQWLAKLDEIAPVRHKPFGGPFEVSLPTPESRKQQQASSNISVLMLLLIGVVIALMAFIVIFAMNSNSRVDIDPVVESEIMAPLYDNIDASIREDIGMYMATIHSQSPLYAETQAMLNDLFGIYELSYDLSGLEVVSYSDNEARVSFVLVTRKISGPAFQDNEITGVFILRPEDGRWKIYNQEINDIRYLN